jgi:hypothetical protein
LSSCKKDLIESADLSTPQTVTSDFKKLKVSADFDWNTNKVVDFKVVGLQTMATINRTLIVSSLDGKQIYFNSLHQMDQNLQTRFTMPKNIKSVKVTYGTIEKVVNSVSSEISFDFIPVSAD